MNKNQIKKLVDKELLSVSEAADILKTSRSNVYYWIDEGKLDAIWRGNVRLLYAKEVMAKSEE